EYVCSPFNDQFIALVNPAPMGSQNGNISFDSNHNPVSVNIGFFDVCDPTTPATKWTQSAGCMTCPPRPDPYCPSGLTELVDTGFQTKPSPFGTGTNDGGGTSWLKTQAPVGGGEEFTIRFAIWDATDPDLDSTILIDNFAWIAGAGSVEVST